MPDMPEWVAVWAWLRFGRSPQVMTPMPCHNALEVMSDAEYERYRDEWRAAGAPTMTQGQLVAVMTAAAHDDGIPF